MERIHQALKLVFSSSCEEVLGAAISVMMPAAVGCAGVEERILGLAFP